MNIVIPELSNENMQFTIVMNLTLQDGVLKFSGGFVKKKYGQTKGQIEKNEKVAKDKEQLALTESVGDEVVEF